MKKINLDKSTIIELVKFYNEPHSLTDTGLKFGISKHKVSDILKEQNVTKRTKAQAQLLGAETQSINCIKATGYSEAEILEYYLQPNTINATCIKFGLSSSTLEWLLNKNNIEKHSNDVIAECQVKKAKQTCLDKYGAESYSNTEEFKARYVSTSLQNFGVENSMQLPEIAAKQASERKKTCLEKYGTDSYFATTEFKNKAIITRQEQYGVSYSGQIESAKQKANETKRQHNSFSTSKIEELFYLKLQTTFKVDDIFRQYRADYRYPFSCDFYIKSLDLFIELNIHWTHGGHIFNSNSIEDLDKIAIWQEKAKTSNFYKRAIEVWTIRDLNKINLAKLNNLNYLTFYTENTALDYKF